GVPAHGGEHGAGPDDGRGAAVRFVRPLEPARLAGRGRRADQCGAPGRAEGGMTRILFAGGGTGGHLYPALALAEAVQALQPGVEVHFVGARRGVEARVLPQRDVPHTLLRFEPLRRDRVWQNWRLGPSLTNSFLGLSKLFLRFRPDLVVGTGGYA